VIWLGKAQNWLEKDLNQHAKAWSYVLKGYLLSETQYLSNFLIVFNVFDKINATEHQLAQAKSVLATIRSRCEGFLKVILPLARKHGVVWHIGTRGHLYRREGMVVSADEWIDQGGNGTRFSIGFDQRIWFIGKDKYVYTGRGPNSSKPWVKLDFQADDICVVKAINDQGDASKRSDVFTIEGAQLGWREWDETQGCFVGAQLHYPFGGGHYTEVSSSCDQRAFLFGAAKDDQAHTLGKWFWRPPDGNVREFSNPGQPGRSRKFKGVTADDTVSTSE
jgi:hypothetical protein